MGRGPSGSRQVLDLFVEHWPLLIFVPTVLILVAVLAVLAGVTRWGDRRDAQRSAEMTRRVDAATGREVAARSARIARSRSRPPVVAANALHLFLAHRPNGDERTDHPGILGERPHTVNAIHVLAQPVVRGEAVLGEQVA